jgi:hypothetical protein
LPIIGGFGPVELAREAATMIMLLTVGMLAGRTWRSRLGYSAIAFGVWDIFYYIFLKVMCGWPHSLFDWDILFLLPLPWWGPVLAPVSIAVLMILWGALATRFDGKIAGAASWRSWGLNFVGVILALYVFMADSIKVAGQGVDILRNVLPEHFNWPWFTVAILLMAAPIASALKRIPKLVAENESNSGMKQREAREPFGVHPLGCFGGPLHRSCSDTLKDGHKTSAAYSQTLT